MNVTIVHIVKRLGCVGGMENYVWHLIHGLADQGQSVAVVCESVFEQPATNIRVIVVGHSAERPRWKSMHSFREKVRETIKSTFKGKTVIIHSHERSLGHQVTTFHGPPINIPARMNILGRLSPRLRAWRAMEREELFGEGVSTILPVSSLILDALRSRYEIKPGQQVELAWPGVHSHVAPPGVLRMHPSDFVHFLFVGKEWKRKGLMFAVAVVREFRQTRGAATLTVFGVDPKEVAKELFSLSWVIFEGWTPNVIWSQYDLLIHPASQEPFGMVVAEARSQGLAVLISERVGAAEMGFSNMQVLSLEAAFSEWCDAAQWLLKQARTAEVKWSWHDLVQKHLITIYPRVTPIQV